MIIKKIAFVGATGMLGRPVAVELIRSGFEVRGLIRRKNAQLPVGLEPHFGDLADERSLDSFLCGQDAVYINLSVKPDERPSDFHTETDGLANLLRSAKKNNLKRVAFLSSLVQNFQNTNGFSWWVFDIKAKALELLKNAGMPYTIYYASTFMENFEGNFRRGNRILLAGTSQHKMWFVAASDFGAQVSRSFHLDKDGNFEWIVQGPEGLTADEAAALYASAYPLSRLKISRAPLALLKFFGRFNRTIDYGAHIVEALNCYPEEFLAEETWRTLGKPATTLGQYAQNATGRGSQLV